MSDKELRKEIEQAVEQERAAHQMANEEPPNEDSSELKRGRQYYDQLRRDFDDNHLGDARRFSERFLGGLVHDNIQGRWYKYQDTHWDQDRGYTHIHKVTEISEDFKNQASFYARKVEETKCSEAYVLAPTKTEKNELIKPLLYQQKAYEQRAKELKDPARIEKVLKMSRVCTDGYLGIIGTEWNKDPYLFACGNKVLDLRTGKALDPDPNFYINRSSTILWDHLQRESVLWETFLLQVFNQDKELISYIQRCVGYWMTGLMTHQEFYCLWGPQGRNGKGVFFRTLRLVMGSYFQMMPSKYLLDEKSLQNTDKPDQHLVALEHTRLACTSEAPKRAKFSEGAIKQLSGGDPITCRGMYSLDVTEYIPKFKMLFATNRIPAANGDDKAFQERLRIIRFPCTFKMGAKPDPETKTYPMDPHLEQKLHQPEELQAILAWCVRGAVDFNNSGNLIPPESVLSDTRSFMEDNDFVGEFITSCLIVHADAPKTNTPADCKCQMKVIYELFKRWCADEKSIPENKIWSMKALGSDFSNRTNLYRVSPKNVVFYNVTIVAEWAKEPNLF